MRRTSSLGSFRQSFLDLLFGSLGAVVLLFILISITSGPPPRPMTPVSRCLSWSIISEELPATNFALFFPGRSKEGTPDPANDVRLDEPSTGEEAFTTETITRNSCLGAVSSERLNVNGRVVQRISVEFPSDDRWISDLALDVRFEKKPSKETTIIVEATPGDISMENGSKTDRNQKTFLGGDLGNRLRIETVIELKEEGSGLLPFMDASGFNVEFKD